jgi:hypothetical protein
MDLVRKQTYLTAEQDRRIKQIAARDSTTEADVVRRAVDAFLATELDTGVDPFSNLISLFEGPETSDHNDIYG